MYLTHNDLLSRLSLFLPEGNIRDSGFEGGMIRKTGVHAIYKIIGRP